MASEVVYATAEELRAAVDVQRDVSDAIISEVLAEASRVVDGICGRLDGFKADDVGSPRSYAGSGEYWLRVGEHVQLEEVELGGIVLAADRCLSYRGSIDWPRYEPPYTRILRTDGMKFPRSRVGPNIIVTARWGAFEEVPGPIRRATVLIAARWWLRGRIGYADTQIPEGGTIRLYQKEVDPDARLLLIRAGYARKKI
jgi:hypothetical protein